VDAGVLARGRSVVKIRVIEVLATLKRAGAERVAVSLACHLDPARFETSVISLYDAFPGGLESELEARGIPVRHLGKRRGFDARMYLRLARVLGAARPVIVHSHSYVLRYTFPAGALARAGRLVHTVHNVAGREVDGVGRMFNRAAFRCGVAPVAVGAEVARSFRGVYGRDVAAVIPNGIDLAAFGAPGAREAWRAAHGYAPGDLLVVSVARLDPQKNPLGLLGAFARAFGSTSRAHLLLAGEGQLADAVRRAAGARVRLLGAVPDVAGLLAAGDVFALASDWEGTPVAVMEAMAAGLPVAATAVGGVPELVTDGETGLLAPAGDEAALAAAITGCMARRVELGAAGRARAAGFGVQAMVSAYAALFERLAGEMA
jgi:glycosyltransferase involved in cell wall biosynthesis